MNDSHKFRVWKKKQKKYWEIDGVDNHNVFINTWGSLFHFDMMLDQDDYVIEQCTGVKDKNGNLIYVGDVVCYDDTPYNGYATKKTGVVVYRKAEFCYKYSDCCGGLYQPLVPSDDFWQRKTEIIGNVHEMELEKLCDCEACHGTGYLKSRCDEPDRICPICHGTGRDD